MSNELAVLQAVRMKGRATLQDVMATTGLNESVTATVVAGLNQEDAFQEIREQVRITATGRERLTELLHKERLTIDQKALREGYDQFHVFNGEFKELATHWQIRDGEPNDHGDTLYDQAILQKLAELDLRFERLLSSFVVLVPRLKPYPVRFSTALERIKSGEHKWFLHPLIDSYHTVWFELHEDIIGLSGLSRESEAAAGRAE